jgi:hypothetical protein
MPRCSKTVCQDAAEQYAMMQLELYAKMQLKQYANEQLLQLAMMQLEIILFARFIYKPPGRRKEKRLA